jgi:hypothetical protein
MRRGFSIGLLLLVVLGGVAIGLGAYHAGVNHGLAQAANARVVHVVDTGYGGFPYGFIFFPLFFFGFFLLLRGAFWGRRWRGGGPWDHRHGPGTPEDRERMEELHRQLHEQASGDHPSAGGEPATV